MKPSKDPSNFFHRLDNTGYLIGTFIGIGLSILVPGRVLPFIKKAVSSKLPASAKMAFIVNPVLTSANWKVIEACNRGVVAVCQRGKLPHISHWAGVGMQEVWHKCDRPTVVYKGFNVMAMEKIRKDALKKGLVIHQVRTKSEEGFSGMLEVLVIGPGPDDVIDKLTLGLQQL